MNFWRVLFRHDSRLQSSQRTTDVPRLRIDHAENQHFAETAVGDRLVSFRLTKDGVARLTAEGHAEDGSTFPQSLFNSLVRTRNAFSVVGSSEKTLAESERGQFFFDFDGDVAAQTSLPRCAETGTFQDLHLVIYRDPSESRGRGGAQLTQILGATPREHLVANTLLSVPVTLLDRNGLRQLIWTGRVDANAVAVQSLTMWLKGEQTDLWQTHDRTGQSGANIRT